MRVLGIDIETYSSIDLGKAGVYAYCSSPDFEILLFAYTFDDDPVGIVDLASGEELPGTVLDALTNEEIVKTAFNANFERTCLAKHLKQKMGPEQWRCTAVQAAVLGLPLYLEGVAKALRLGEQKMNEGKALIRYYSVPCKATKANGGRTRNLPSHKPEKWALFKEYCKQDVEVERSVRKKIDQYLLSEREQKLWVLDQQINDRGVLVDAKLVKHAIQCDSLHKTDLVTEAKEITKLANPNSVSQLKQWLIENGVQVESLTKKAVSEMAGGVDGEIERLLQLRQELAKTSIQKYQAISRAVCPDRRVRGLLQFYGANRTGRWAGRLVQVHNLPQNKIPDLHVARQLISRGLYESVELLYGSTPMTLSQLIRTAFIPSPGHRFIVADFSAIEARVIAWLAGEKWRLDVFQSHGKIYEASASQMFKVPIEQITKASLLRQKGKIAELALGYQGAVNALIKMGALEMGLNEEELAGLVKAWRNANPNIVGLWYAVEAAAKRAVGEKTPGDIGKIHFHSKDGILFITLPSGRMLSYIRPRIEPDPKYNRESLTYEGVDQISKHWGRQPTYGGKLVENIVQATARDCLAEAMLRLDEAGYRIVMHVHDEVIADMPKGNGSVEEMCTIMGQPIPWAEGLPLKAEGFETEFYRKD